MDRDECWRVIAEQRRSLADLLSELADDEWERPSLCAGWRVRDVVAHVAMTPQPPTVAGLIAGAVRVRGDFDRLNHDLAVAHAVASPGQLIAELREHADSRRRAAITTYRNLLFDVIVHGQDVAIPLGRTLPVAPAAAREGLQRVWTMGWPFWARRRLRGVRLTATDADWSAGSGPEVSGPALALLLLTTGRTGAALPALDGAGVGQVATA